MKSLIDIRPMVPSDENFVIDSWLKSNWGADHTLGVPRHTYYVNHRRFVEECLRRSKVYVAVSKENHDLILGWVCIEPGQGGKVKALHYIYVKHSFRNYGIARELLSDALEEELFSFSHQPEGKLLKRLSNHGHYDPYRFYRTSLE